jgi:protein CpxP
MTRYRYFATGSALVALLVTGVAFAQGPRGGPFGRGGAMGPGRGPGMALGALNLTDAQRSQITDIRARHRDDAQAASEQLRTVQQKQREAIETFPVNEALITSLSQDLAQAEVNMAIQEARLNADIWAVLTPDQQAQLTKLRADRQARMEERRQQMQQRRQNRQ